jgi:hypothetical protein
MVAVQFAHLRDSIPDLPHEYEHFKHIINKMLAKHPKDRFYKIGDFIEALSSIK